MDKRLIRIESLLQALIEKQYDIDEAWHEGKHLCKLTKSARVRKTKEVTYSDEFNKAMDIYPDRAGSNPKKAAFNQWKQRIYDNDDPTVRESIAMINGASRYKAFCDATGKTKTEYVMQASRFFGRDKHYLEDWTIPKEVTRLKLPSNKAEWPAFAEKHGLSKPRVGEEMWAYEQRLQREIGERND